MKPDVQLFKTLIALQGDGSDVYEIVDGELCPRGDIEECEGEDIVATFDAWARSEEDLTVEKGSKALFWDDNKAFFHWFQVSDAGRAHFYGGHGGGCDDWEYEAGDFYGGPLF